MKTRPILFSGEMVRAILEGRKTQTRRVIKPQPANANYWTSVDKAFFPNTYTASPSFLKCPYGQKDDRLWVRETWATIKEYDDLKPSAIPKGSASWPMVYYGAWTGAARESSNRGKWRPSIFMPRWASRITLEVTDVRVEQVQNISAVDAMWEGIEKAHHPINKKTIEALGDKSATGLAVIEDFCLLWDSINAKRGYSWESNPWVWAVEFQRVER